MSKNIGYLVLLISAATLAVGIFRYMGQQKMMKDVCAKYKLGC